MPGAGEPDEEWWEGSKVRAQRTLQVIGGLWACFQSHGESQEVCEQVSSMTWKGTRVQVSSLPFFGFIGSSSGTWEV